MEAESCRLFLSVEQDTLKIEIVVLVDEIEAESMKDADIYIPRPTFAFYVHLFLHAEAEHVHLACHCLRRLCTLGWKEFRIREGSRNRLRRPIISFLL